MPISAGELLLLTCTADPPPPQKFDLCFTSDISNSELTDALKQQHEADTVMWYIRAGCPISVAVLCRKMRNRLKDATAELTGEHVEDDMVKVNAEFKITRRHSTGSKLSPEATVPAPATIVKADSAQTSSNSIPQAKQIK